jgi:hypothetical protein
MLKHYERSSIPLDASCAAVQTRFPRFRIRPFQSQRVKNLAECSSLRVLQPLEDIKYRHIAGTACSDMP